MNSTPILRGKSAVVFGPQAPSALRSPRNSPPKGPRSSCPDARSPTWKLWPNKSRAAAGERRRL
jgi:hypothetical protein